MENKEELKVIVDRVGLRRFDERAYITINREDEKKLIKFMAENSIPYNLDEDPIKPYAEYETEIEVELDLYGTDRGYNNPLNEKEQKAVFANRDCVVGDIYEIMSADPEFTMKEVNEYIAKSVKENKGEE